jgi:hypothetical protein
MIAVEKFGQHQPLNRWAECYAREGVPLSLSTVADQVSPVRVRGQGAAGDASVPLANASNADAKIAEVLCLRARRSGRRFPRPPFLRSSFDSGPGNPVVKGISPVLLYGSPSPMSRGILRLGAVVELSAKLVPGGPIAGSSVAPKSCYPNSRGHTGGLASRIFQPPCQDTLDVDLPAAELLTSQVADWLPRMLRRNPDKLQTYPSSTQLENCRSGRTGHLAAPYRAAARTGWSLVTHYDLSDIGVSQVTSVWDGRIGSRPGFSLKGMVQSASASSVRRPPRTGSLSSLRIRVTSVINIEDVHEE